MKSRISIEVDFDNNNSPVIQILSQDSDDVRDRLIKSFLQSTSRWCIINYIGEANTFEDLSINKTKWQIIPVTPKQLECEIKLMQACVAEIEKHNG